MLRPEESRDIPEMMRLVARAAFPKGSLAMTLRDEFGPLFEDEMLVELYPTTGQSAVSPARLAMVTIWPRFVASRSWN